MVMSASDENNSCSQSNTVVFEMIDGQLVVSLVEKNVYGNLLGKKCFMMILEISQH